MAAGPVTSGGDDRRWHTGDRLLGKGPLKMPEAAEQLAHPEARSQARPLSFEEGP